MTFRSVQRPLLLNRPFFPPLSPQSSAKYDMLLFSSEDFNWKSLKMSAFEIERERKTGGSKEQCRTMSRNGKKYSRQSANVLERGVKEEDRKVPISLKKNLLSLLLRRGRRTIKIFHLKEFIDCFHRVFCFDVIIHVFVGHSFNSISLEVFHAITKLLKLCCLFLICSVL